MNYKDWYCVMVAAGCEKKAQADLLARRAVLDDRFILNVEVPEATEMKFKKDGKRRVVKTKVLPGYILVQVKKEKIEDELGNVTHVFPAFTQETIKDTANVLGFAGANKNKPRMMKPKEMELLFNRVDDTHLEVKQNVVIDYQEGDLLDVVSGPFAGYTCEVVSIQGTKIVGQLDMFGRQVSAEFTKEQVYKK
jgi:transcriptional antiterminator NusG